jgi:hypothetical protein
MSERTYAYSNKVNLVKQIENKKIFVYTRYTPHGEQITLYLAETKEEVMEYLAYHNLHIRISELVEKDITILKSKSDLLDERIETIL